ncbi:MAG: hypothetical protein WAK93_14470 [Solirubrobacteraceae bacterium]
MINQSASIERLPRWEPECIAELLRPRLLTRLAAFVRRSKLDRLLSEGADPTSTTQLAARAAQLARRSTRANVATGLEHMALTVDDPPSHVRIRPSRQAALANRSTLLDLAAVLRRNEPVYARGIARLRLLVTDGTGPAYTDRRGEALAHALALAACDLAG